MSRFRQWRADINGIPPAARFADEMSPRQPKSFDCPRCPDFTSPDADETYVHLMSRHQDQRRYQTPIHPMRRTGDGPTLSPVLRRFAQSAAAGIGCSTDASRARSRLS